MILDILLKSRTMPFLTGMAEPSSALPPPREVMGILCSAQSFTISEISLVEEAQTTAIGVTGVRVDSSIEATRSWSGWVENWEVGRREASFSRNLMAGNKQESRLKVKA
jgi:hypothetical protein